MRFGRISGILVVARGRRPPPRRGRLHEATSDARTGHRRIAARSARKGRPPAASRRRSAQAAHEPVRNVAVSERLLPDFFAREPTVRDGWIHGQRDGEAESSIPRATFDYLASLEWIQASENLVLMGPAGTGKSHTLIAVGHAVVEGRLPGPLLRRGIARRGALPRDRRQQRGAPHRGLLRADLVIVDDLGFAPLDDTGAQLLFRFVAAAYERRSLGVASHWPFESWGRFLPEHTTAVALLDRLLHHAVTVVTSGDSYRMKEARTRAGGPSTKA
jgi:DNA replication protein DnaC